MSEEHKEEKDFTEKAKDTAKEIGSEAKEAAKEFGEGVKEVVNSGENKKVLAGVLAIILGGLGVHKFILGYTKEGIIQILLSFLCGLGGIIGLVEGIIYLVKSDEEFYNTYQVGKKPWF
ncbi:TM2 domain-containing protein [Sinomicrobium sp.]